MSQEIRPFVNDYLGGAVGGDHQNGAMFFNGRYKRTYVTYQDHHFNARVMYYDHETNEWAFPNRIDTCIRGKHPDGHNSPNIFVTQDGFLHLFYGSHNHSFKYARSKDPENIDEWETGMLVGENGTYPYFAQTENGELMVFYRYGPTGPYNHPYLVVQHSSDQGRHWGEMKKLATFVEGCKIYGNNALYDPSIERVHLVLNIPVNFGDPKKLWWKQYYCQYEPESGKLYAMNGECIGPVAEEEDFRRNSEEILDKKIIDMFLHNGVLFFLFQNQEGKLVFARWENSEIEYIQIPANDKTKGLFPTHPTPFTSDGQMIQLYGLSATSPATSFKGGDLIVWTSYDGGRTWDEGNCLLDRRSLGHGLQKLGLVMNCPAAGMRVIVSEPPGEWPESRQLTAQNHYDNPERRDRRLYALDSDGNIM